MNERRIIARLKRGDITALAALVEKHQHAALRTAVLITRDTALAEDVVQGAFLRAYEKIDGFDSNRSFAPWFLRSVANAALQAIRIRDRDFSLDDASDEAEDSATFTELLPAETGDPVMSFERAEVRAAIRQALDELAPEQRTTVIMAYYLDMTAQEIADEMERPVGTIKWRLHHARKRLRGLLNKPEQTREPNNA